MRKLNRIERAGAIARSLGVKVAAKYCVRHGLSLHAALWVILRQPTLRPAPTWKTWLNRRNDVPNGEQVGPVHERSEPAHCEPDSDSCPTTPVQHLTRLVGSPTASARAEGSSSAKLPFIAVTYHTQSEGEELWKHFVK